MDANEFFEQKKIMTGLRIGGLSSISWLGLFRDLFPVKMVTIYIFYSIPLTFQWYSMVIKYM
jgi:hypothetical protein